MKKLLALVLAGVMVMGLSVTAMAETQITTLPGSDSEQVEITVNPGTKTPTYRVDVTWEDLTFNYDFKADATWDPATHTYSGDATTEGWNKTTANITVTNHSNVPVGVVAAFEKGGVQQSLYGVTAKINNDKFDLATGEGLTFETADSKVIQVVVAGKPSTTTGFTLDTVKVNISAK